jgi:hypothetical protein
MTLHDRSSQVVFAAIAFGGLLLTFCGSSTAGGAAGSDDGGALDAGRLDRSITTGPDAGADQASGPDTGVDDVVDAGAVPPDGATAVDAAGATVPYTTYEAENMTTNVPGGAIVMSRTPPPSSLPNPVSTPTLENLAAIESSGRAFVSLVNSGDYVELEATAPANRFVVRFTVPDSASGGGLDTQIGLYVNGVRQTLPLSSAHGWLYGMGTNADNDPSDGWPHHFWDEAQAVIPNVLPGDKVRLQRDAEDTAAFYWIDLVDLEQVAKTAMPANAVSVLSCEGAVEAMGADSGTFNVDATALSTCLDAGAASGKAVYFPEGRFIQNEKIEIPANGGLVGAGMWFTTFYSTAAVTDFGGPFGFNMNGANGVLSDVKVDTTVDSRANGGSAITGGSSGWTVQRVWIEHTGTGMWVGATSHSVVQDSRFRDTYADGVNVNDGSSYVTIQNNSFRGTGDDSIASYSSAGASDGAGNSYITVAHNTVVQPWFAHGLALYGGSNIVFDENLVTDPAYYAGLIVGVYPQGNSATYPLAGATVSNNTIVRGGGWTEKAALYMKISVNMATDVSFTNNTVLASLTEGMVIAPGPTQTTWKGNRIEAPAGDGIKIESGAVGTASFDGDQVTSAGGSAYLDQAASSFAVTKTATNF